MKFGEIKQQAPFTVIVEPTEGCNLGCDFCGLRGMREHGTTPFFFMSLETAERIASEVARAGWTSKVVFANHGEPTVNQNLKEIIAIFRRYLPNALLHMFTNGFGFKKAKDVDKYVDDLFAAGLNNIIVDSYEENGDWTFVYDLDQDKRKVVVYEEGVPLFSTTKKPRLLLVPPIQLDENERSTRKLANHCGAAAPLDPSYNNKRCTMPFREMVFRHDGNVNLCCDDFRGEYPIANIHEMAIEDIWNHERFQAARIMLYNRDRRFRPCHGCTNVSMRVGLLPDSQGKETLPEITKEVRDVATRVHRRGTLSKIIIKRPWEEK